MKAAGEWQERLRLEFPGESQDTAMAISVSSERRKKGGAGEEKEEEHKGRSKNGN